MTHHTVQFKSAIPELGRVGSLEQQLFKERLKTGVERISLSSVGRRFHARGRQQKTPSCRISDGSWERRSCRL